MKSHINVFTVILLSFFSLASAQDDFKLRGLDLPENTTYVNDIPAELETTDYKIISSNSSYIELEFYPSFTQPSIVRNNGEELKSVSFVNSIQKDISNAGQPDLRYRAFPIILPSENNNNVTIVDFDVNEIHGYHLAPIPNVKSTNPISFRFDRIDYFYDKDPASYSVNTFIPENIASIKQPGIVRDMTIGSLMLYPVQYNPVSKVLKQYTRLRVRINFGQQPVLINRVRSRTEYEFIKDVALNSDVAINWVNPGSVRTGRQIIESAMREGNWYRVEIKDNGDGTSEGVYKITKQQLEAAGINLSGIDPRTIKMYGNGGRMLPENPTLERPVDLEQIAIHLEGEGDGSFDQNDHILFYARSVHYWYYNNNQARWSHFLNYYTNSNIYWIQTGTSNNGKRITTVQSPNSGSPININTFTDNKFYESEKNNLIFEGNLWLSERLSNGQALTWNTTLPGLAPNTTIDYRVAAASRVFFGFNNYMNISDDHANFSPVFFPLCNVMSGGFGDWICPSYTSFQINSSQKTSENLGLKATFFTDQPDGEGYIDWYEVSYQRLLLASNDYIKINPPVNQTGTLQYNVSSFSSNQIRILNVTDHDDVTFINPLNVTSNSVRFQVEQMTNFDNELVLTGPNGYKTPTAISNKVPNQNLHGFSEGADLIIVSHNSFMTQAVSLKERRESPGVNSAEYLKTHIVNVDDIMNEFGGGVYDASAVRDYLKYAYENWTRKPFYVFLIGDGSLDYKNITGKQTNFVPVYEVTSPTINQVNGYTSDDYFVQFNAMLGSPDPPDISIGRLPVQTPEESRIYFDKLDVYESFSVNGYWKNKMTFVADDGKTTSGNDGTQHTDQVEQLSEIFVPEIYEKAKLYLVAYPTVITSHGRRKPDCNADIIKHWNDGNIMVNYTGHGSPEVWAHEYVFEIDVALNQLKNVNKYPFLTVASCDFSKIDNPITQSGGEKIVNAANKGAIGSLAATRPVYGGQNSYFNNKFWSELFNFRDTLRLPRTFGKAVFNTKQTNFQVNDLKFVLLGDPTARVQVPRFQSRLDSVSGLTDDTLKALSRVKLYGSVIRPDSSVWTDYNGKAYVKFFDVSRAVAMRDEDGFEFRFVQNGGIIFSGTQNVVNGLWTTEFVVPKDISYQNRNGKLISYFNDNSNTNDDGHGLDKRFIVGGIDPNAPIDTTGPDIKLFINTRNFRTGDVVNSNFELIADLFDESGINTTGTIGHKLEVIIDDDENMKFDVTNFYNSDTTFRSGTINASFNNIPEGKHTLKLRAWDTYNNSSTATIDFTVSDYNGLQVMNVYNIPNPFKDNTTFTFMHNFPDAVNVKIKVYTVSGRLIKEISQDNINDKFVSILWSGRDEDDETLANGVYIYRLTVDTFDGTSSVTTTGKLAVLK